MEETLEEASVKTYKKLYEGEPLTQEVPIDAFKQGVKWQQERSYSEDEVMDMFHNLSMHLPLHYEFLVKEQFKNK